MSEWNECECWKMPTGYKCKHCEEEKQPCQRCDGLKQELQEEKKQKKEWKEKYKELNRGVMAELRDPCGTIWDTCKKIQDESYALKDKVREVIELLKYDVSDKYPDPRMAAIEMLEEIVK